MYREDESGRMMWQPMYEDLVDPGFAKKQQLKQLLDDCKGDIAIYYQSPRYVEITEGEQPGYDPDAPF